MVENVSSLKAASTSTQRTTMKDQLTGGSEGERERVEERKEREEISKS